MVGGITVAVLVVLSLVAALAAPPGAWAQPASLTPVSTTPTTSTTPAGQGPSATTATAPPGEVAVVFELTPPTTWPQPPVGTARAVYAIDAQSGQVLAQHHPDERMEVASTIKLVTALTARRLYDLDQSVTVAQEVEVGGSTAALDPGDTWTVEQLLWGLLLRSGNDAAEALAVAGGDRDGFIAQMNTTLADLGVSGATVVEPNGLDDANLMSARDLATVALAVLDDPVLAEIVGAETGTLPSTGPVPNRNLLLGRLDNAVGIKTGTTDVAGASLVGAAVWQDRTVITVVLATVADEARYDETVTLLHWIDEIGTATVQVGGRIRRPGEWVGQDRDLVVWAPDDVAVDTTVAVDGSTITSRVLTAGESLAQAVVTTPSSPGGRDDGQVGPSPSAGEAVAATTYDALRSAVQFGVLGSD